MGSYPIKKNNFEQLHLLLMVLLLTLLVLKKLLANGLSTFFIKDKPIFSNGPRSLPKIFPDCPILCNLAFDCFILSNKLFKLYEASKLVC